MLEGEALETAVERALCRRHPGGEGGVCGDEPDLAVLDGAGGIALRWFGMAARVGMIMADDAEAIGAGVSVGGEQQGRIDFEMGFGLFGDIAGRAGLLDMAGAAEQQAASLMRQVCPGMGHYGLCNSTCNPHDHHNIAI